jgi:PIN domain nuclease of toxin-antitoxin system
VIHLDTHALVWFLTGQTAELRPIAHKLRAPIGLSPLVFLEIQYLHDSGKLGLTGAGARKDVAGLREFVVSPTPLLEVLERSLALDWTRDPFDRLIVGNALADGAVLLTRDRQILERCRSAAWG